jgi:XapX domain-containing protein
MKIVLGIAIAFALGFVCRCFGLPSPAPTALIGALLVLAMTVGYTVADRFMTTRARHSIHCAGPSGHGTNPGEKP